MHTTATTTSSIIFENSFVTVVALPFQLYYSRKWMSNITQHFEKSFVTVVALKKAC